MWVSVAPWRLGEILYAREVTSQNLWSQNDRHFVRITLYRWCTVVSPTSKYDGPEVENVAQGRSPSLTFSTEGHHIWMSHEQTGTYEGHSKSHLPDYLTITLAFCFWHSIIEYIKYITAAEYQLAQYLATGHVTLFFTWCRLLLWICWNLSTNR